MILVTGATGTTGSALVRDLLARGVQVAAMTRDPARVEPRPGLTVTTRVVPADAIYLVCLAGPATPGLDVATLGAAVDAGIRRVVLLSAIGTPEHDVPAGRVGSLHRPAERALRESSGLLWTILRPTTFASNTLAYAGDIRAGRPVPNLFGDGQQGVIDPADVSAVAAEVLTGRGHEGRTYTLTGPELLTFPEQMAYLGATTVDVPLSEARAYFPYEIADLAMDGAAMVRAGGNAVVTGDVETVLGRKPGTFSAWAEANQHRFHD
jgi:uncharacterized protein YbjT (DUF2867 family)